MTYSVLDTPEQMLLCAEIAHTNSEHSTRSVVRDLGNLLIDD